MSRNPARLLALLLLPGCGGADMAPAENKAAEMEEIPDRFVEMLDEDEGGWAGGGDATAAAPAAPPPPGAKAAPKRMKGNREQLLSGMRGESKEEAPDDAEASGEGQAAPARAWFPETFLFAPQVVTDDAGDATVPVPVPDRLTTWRVLGLAHDKAGRTAGAVHSFDGRLPLSVEAVVPPFLTAGDVVRLPVQVANTTDADVDARLDLQVEGAVLLEAPAGIRIPAGGSATAWCVVQAEAAGQARVSVRLQSEAGGDAVERSFPVEPSGRRVEQARSGTLAAARALDVFGPADLDPASARAQLVVHPGALSVLRAELAGAGSRSGLAGTAHALTLGTRGAALLTALGLTPTTEGPESAERAAGEALQRLRSRAGQRALRAARSPDLGVALYLAEPALADPDNEAVRRLGDRLARTLVQAQRPDGSYVMAGRTQTTQRMVVTTAAATEVISRLATAEGLEPAEAARRQREAELVRVRAAGVFERHGAAATDAYSAAAMLVSGALDGDPAEAARGRLTAALEARDDGSRVLPVAEGVLGVDGTPPTEVEATAMAALALQQSHPDLAADLGAAVLGAWRPGVGWGDGASDLRCLQAVLALFAEPLPAQVTLTLSRDGQEVARRTLQDAALRDLAVLDAPAGPAAGPHTWTVAADPAVPGLGFAFTLTSWVPWTGDAPTPGLELDLAVPADLRVGQPARLVVAAAAPAGTPLTIALPLPPGMDPDTRALDALKVAGTVSTWEADDSGIVLTAPALRAGQPLRVEVPVVPTLAGRFGPAPAALTVAARPDTPARTPSRAWVVRPAASVAAR